MQSYKWKGSQERARLIFAQENATFIKLNKKKNRKGSTRKPSNTPCFDLLVFASVEPQSRLKQEKRVRLAFAWKILPEVQEIRRKFLNSAGRLKSRHTCSHNRPLRQPPCHNQRRRKVALCRRAAYEKAANSTSRFTSFHMMLSGKPSLQPSCPESDRKKTKKKRSR